ncbi:MAG TPA: transcription-repair coupling factor [Pyrinomonadaceae bacterium]|nr:transcription-repair coupling factor [Pyrinomonadaceae bacterium]
MQERREFHEIGKLEAAIGSSRVVSLDGLTSIAAKSFILAQVEPSRTTVIITDSNSSLDTWECDLRFWTRDTGASILSLPSFETDVYSGSSPHAETMERRALTLWNLGHSTPEFLIVSVRSLVTRTLTPEEIAGSGTMLRLNDEIALDKIIETLSGGGYEREDPVTGVGQFSVRGGILDVWPPDGERPVRVEFFGDIVDSIREFDPDTQLSVEKILQAALPPMREFTASPQDLKDWAFFARDKFSGDIFARSLLDRTEFASEGETFTGWEFLIPLVKPLKGTLFDFVADPVFVVDEPAVVEQTLAAHYDNLRRRYASLSETGEIGLEPGELFLETPAVRQLLENKSRIELRALGRSAAETDEEFVIEGTGMGGNGRVFSKSSEPLFLFPTAERSTEIVIQSRSTRKFHGDISRLSGEINDITGARFVFDSPGIAERFEELLEERGISLPDGSIFVGPLSTGFEIPSAQLIYYTELDVFGERSEEGAPQVKVQPRKTRLGAFISDFRDLKPGDYVVHVDHGIGRFEGLQTITSQGAEREFMLLVYADDAKLFVPVERLDLVSRYSSAEASAVQVDRLGGLGWQRTKAKAKRAMRDMADELLRLYAERKLVKGYAFSADAPWQHEFEDAFPYDLTIDQAKAIEDVKGDMETPRPMDRLIIGDVGYGKTEVAMRAAFKAVMDGKQVAILSPTTILAYQHYESFRKRFAAFPAKIDLLSRFRSKSEQKSVTETAKNGDIDVLIGTHRILSNDVSLPKLGLLVVDEEQRFGVAHKEKLKQLKKKVDVLTLSATPIPRTLNMSLIGMRDMSIIETPPRDRLAINTQVVQFSENVIRSAIELELSRNGQVFFIHNRVETIEAIAALVQKIVPNARIAIGHGQMNEKEMEQVMLDFIDYKYDILVATTIVENGIDIPRANTIIINRADNYGLSQLYQLRGRVGRSNRRAYAYLLIPSELELTPIARRRLSAIREFSDLGAGFRLAALDLELRGAGNILGGQQSGHLDALGFDLYTKMLERTIAEMRGDEIADEINVSINLGVDVAIPKEYIVEASQRLRSYKRISSAESDEALAMIHEEIEDRYGRIPEPVENLFLFGRLRKLAERMGIVSIDRVGSGIAIKLSENAKILPEKLMEVLESTEGSTFSPSGILRIADVSENPLNVAVRVLESIRSR